MTDNRLQRHLVAIGLVFASLTVLPGALHAQQRHGDVNGDGVVSALDAQAILSGVVGLTLPPGYVFSNGDSNCDDATGAIDAQVVLSFVIGLNVSQMCVNQPFGPAAITVRIVPSDTSVLINRGLMMRATLVAGDGSTPQRPIVWSSSNADLVTIDSTRGDT
ncbi:MAG TPA: hypothetical protein VEB19_00975, partial [Gemmatimonadaceae bacterium]|nr:hypothetical protein [Gemmatimonadaceae bacterium]